MENRWGGFESRFESLGIDEEGKAERLLHKDDIGTIAYRPIRLVIRFFSLGWLVLNKREDWETLIERSSRSPSRAETMNRSWEFAAER